MSNTVSNFNNTAGLNLESLISIIKDEKTGEEKRYMNVQNRVFWFRTKNPLGKIVTNILEKNNDYAIVEARVYLSKDDEDKNYISKGIAQRHHSSDKTYSQRNIEWAETAAIGRALALAGYGTQFCSNELDDNGVVDSPLGVVESSSKVDSSQEKSTKADKSEKTKARVESKATVSNANSKASNSDSTAYNVTTKPEVVTDCEQQTIISNGGKENTKEIENKIEEPKPLITATIVTDESTEVDDKNVKSENIIPKIPEPVINIKSEKLEAEEPKEEAPPIELPKYSKTTPVDEIVELMSFEDAQNTIFDVGPNRGKTMIEIYNANYIDDFFNWCVNSFGGNNNMIKAAAKILLPHYNDEKAS